MNDIDFEKEMNTLGVRTSQLPEMRKAHAQTSEGFELVLARAQGANSPAGALVSLIREGAHLKAAGIHTEDRKNTTGFVCKFCGTLPKENHENHYTNFPEHEHGKPSVVNYPPPLPRRPQPTASSGQKPTPRQKRNQPTGRQQ